MHHPQQTVQPGRRLLSLVVAGALGSAAVLFALAPGQASAVPTVAAVVPGQPDLGSLPAPELTAEQRRQLTAQQPYLNLDERVRQYAGTASSSLAGVRLNPANRSVHVYWAGAVPGGLELIQRGAVASGVSLVVERAAFSEQQLMGAANQLGAFAEATGTRMSVALHVDGSGLTVTVPGGLRAAELDRATATPGQVGLLTAIGTVRARTGVPVSVVDDPTMQSTPADRNNDWTPFWAGAVTRAAGNTCTSAFSMYATGAPTRFMLTAAHCSNFTDTVPVTNGIGQPMGFTDFIHELFDATPRYDLGVIRLNSGLSNQRRMYLNQTTANGATVVGTASSGIPSGGNYCVSGAVSTPNCNLRSGGQVLNCDSWIPFGRCIYAISFTSTNGGIVMCRGDSGGPVYYWNSAGVVASGVVSFGYLDFAGQNCFTRGGISVVATAVNNISGLRVLV